MPLYYQTPERYLVPEQRGWIAETIPINTAVSGTVAPTAGLLNVVRITLPRACSVTNIIMSVSTQGTALTSGQNFVALYTGAGVKVGVSADQTAAWGTTGLKTAALASGPFSMPAGNAYIGWWSNAGTTLVSMHRGVSLAAATLNSGFASPNLPVCSADGSLTTTAPDPLSAQTAAGVYWYAAVS